MVRRLFLRPVAVLLGAVFVINGCYQWNQGPVSATLQTERPPAAARIRMVDGRQFVILQPQMVGDSLVGRIDSLETGPASLPRYRVTGRAAVPLTSVSSVETRHLNGWATGGMMLAVVVGLSLIPPPCFFCGP